jgi:hypothetical protein
MHQVNEEDSDELDQHEATLEGCVLAFGHVVHLQTYG